jgi:hypothetical protein
VTAFCSVFSVSWIFAFPFKVLHNWRDGIARQEDESTGYILPNKALLEIGIAFFLGLLCYKNWCVSCANC